MTWTKKQPTKEGWYWFRTPRISARIGQVYKVGHRQLWVDLPHSPPIGSPTQSGTGTLIYWPDAEWAGPIEEPQD